MADQQRSHQVQVSSLGKVGAAANFSSAAGRQPLISAGHPFGSSVGPYLGCRLQP